MSEDFVTLRNEEIIEKLLEAGFVAAGELIDYEEFKDLYSDYAKEMSEPEFALILGISYDNFKHLKYNGKKAKVLKDRIPKISEERKEKIIEELLETGKITTGESIDFNKFQNLYSSYAIEMRKQEFALILGISYDNFRNLKYNGKKAKVLKDRISKISEERKEEIINELLKTEFVVAGELIDYEEFKKLYSDYAREISEQEFALVLGILYSNYYSMKCSGSKAKVLKDRINKISEERKKEIIEELLEEEFVVAGELIDYEEFKKLYSDYAREISEQEFALILGISNCNYRNLRYKKTKAKILKYRIPKISEERKEEIINELLETRVIATGELIDYEEFKELYSDYAREMSEQEFALILSISHASFYFIKSGRNKARVHNFRIKENTNRIKYFIKQEERFYTKEEIEEICNKYNITVEDFIAFVILNGNYDFVSQYIEALNKNETVYIGKTRCSEEFLNHNIEMINQIIKKATYKSCKKYSCLRLREDITSDTMIYVIEQCGDLEKNFGTNMQSYLEVLIYRINVFLKYRCIEERKPKEVSAIRIYRNHKNELDIDLTNGKDTTVNVEDEVEDIFINEEDSFANESEFSMLQLLKLYINNGATAEFALEKVAKRFNLTIEKAQKLLQEEMLQTGKARQGANGSYILGNSEQAANTKRRLEDLGEGFENIKNIFSKIFLNYFL